MAASHQKLQETKKSSSLAPSEHVHANTVISDFRPSKLCPGIEPRSHAFQVDSLPVEPQGKPMNTGVGSLSLLQQICKTDFFSKNFNMRKVL